jgi:3-methylcrotonyl-CoA carboxylase alpha subunit
VAIGAAPASDSYLSSPRVIAAARTSGADAIHPGYGFLSENPPSRNACADAGVIFVGPPAGVMETMGSKIEARRWPSRAGRPVVLARAPSDQGNAGLRQAIERVGLPALIKASAGGGGRGCGSFAIRRRRRGDRRGPARSGRRIQRRHALRRAADRRRAARRDPDIRGRLTARASTCSRRDCSVQRRHQKVIEESPRRADADLRRA